jgi:hypothetical protein
MRKPVASADEPVHARRSDRLGVAVVILLLLTAVTCASNFFMLVNTSVVISSATIQPDSGKAFRAMLPAQDRGVFESQFDSWDRSLRRNVLLYEDGTLLGLVPAPLGKIRELGHGRFSQWGPSMIFSASDDSDPRSNHRAYSVEFPLFVKSSLQWSLALVTLIAAMGWLWRLGYEGVQRLLRIMRDWIRGAQSSARMEVLVNGAAAFVVLGGLWAVNKAMLDATGSLPLLSPDSPSYAQWYLMRTPGYPLFLKGVLALFHDARWIVPIQLNILLGSMMVMGGMIGWLFQSRLIGLAIILSCFCATPVLANAWFVMTEAVYGALICLHVASAAYLIRTGSPLAAVLVGGTLGAVIAVRPSGYSLLAGLPVLIVCVRERWRVVTGCVAVGVGLVLLLTVAAQYQRHGILGTQSFGGYSLAGYVAPLIAGNLQTEYAEIGGRVERRIQALVDALPDPSQRYAHAVAYADVINPVMYGNLIPEMDAYLKEVEPNLDGPARWRKGDAIAGALAMAGIRNNLGWYLAHCTATYEAYWRNLYQPMGRVSRYVPLNLEKSKALLEESGESFPGFEAEWYDQVRGSHDGIDRIVDTPTEWLDDAWAVLPYTTKPFVIGVCIFSLFAALSALWIYALPDGARLVAYLALLLQGNIMFISLVVTVNYRMLTPLMPLVIAISTGGAGLLAVWLWRSTRGMANRIQAILQNMGRINAENPKRT